MRKAFAPVVLAFGVASVVSISAAQCVVCAYDVQIKMGTGSFFR